jgi:hypothetical protein
MSTFTAHVERLGCSGGVTGTAIDPQIALRDDEVVITFTVKELPDGPQLCPGNDEVAVGVDLGEPIGNRTLVDGACVSGTAAASTGACSDGSVRWTPPVERRCSLDEYDRLGTCGHLSGIGLSIAGGSRLRNISLWSGCLPTSFALVNSRLTAFRAGVVPHTCLASEA